MKPLKGVFLAAVFGMLSVMAPMSWGFFVPKDNFLVVSSGEDTIEVFYDRFSDQRVTLATYRALLAGLNPHLPRAGIVASKALEPGTIITLPGQATLSAMAETTVEKPGLAHVKSETSSIELDKRQDGDANTLTNRSWDTDARERVKRAPGTALPLRYVVKYGDTLSTIAAKHRVKLRLLASWNNIAAPYHIRYGQTLMIPNSAQEAGGNNVLPKQESLSPASSAVTHNTSDQAYIVQYGDTLSEIAAKHNMDTSVLASRNNILIPYHIDVGQTLMITDPPEDVVGVRPLSQGKRVASAIAIRDVAGDIHSLHAHEKVFESSPLMYCLTASDVVGWINNLRSNFSDSLSSHDYQRNYDPLLQYLKDLGFLKASITSANSTRAFYLTIGARYTLANVLIRPEQEAAPNNAGNKKRSGEWGSFVVNRMYSSELRQNALTQASDWLADQGYPLSNTDNAFLVFKDKEPVVDLIVVFDPNDIVEVKNVSHQGDLVLGDDQLAILSPFSKQPRFSMDSLDTFRARMLETGYYSDVSFELLANERGGVIEHSLAVSTEPFSASNLSVAAGYGSEVGAIFSGEIAFKNMTGSQDDLSLGASLDGFERQAAISYRRRNLRRYGFDLGLHISASDDDHPYFTGERLAAGMSAEWRDTTSSMEEERGLLSFELGFLDAEEFRANDPIRRQFHYATSALSYTPSKCRYVPFTTDCHFLLGYGYSTGSQGDDYLQAGFSATFAIPIGLEEPLKIGAKIDGRSARNLSDIPMSAQLFHGGPASNRGYATASFSSTDLGFGTTAWMAQAQIESPYRYQFGLPWLQHITPFLDLSLVDLDWGERSQGFASLGVRAFGVLNDTYGYFVDIGVPVADSGISGIAVNVNFNSL